MADTTTLSPIDALADTARWLDDQADQVERIGVDEPDVYELTRAAASRLRGKATQLRQFVIESKEVRHAVQ